MKTWRFILAGLLIVGSILAQTPPASPLTKGRADPKGSGLYLFNFVKIHRRPNESALPD
jgi:hypothetical protein